MREQLANRHYCPTELLRHAAAIFAIWLAAGIALGMLPAWAEEGAAVDYLRDIKPILSQRCFACHGPLQQKSALRVDTGAAMLQGGDGGAAVVPGKSAESLIISAVTGDGMERMPKDEPPLTHEQIAQLQAWIDAGAQVPADEKPLADPRTHWAFLPPQRPSVPQASAAASANPIDAFLEAEQAKRGLIAALPAAPEVLLRRVYLDLWGIPPTREEQQAFLADASPDAYERVVDRLLSSPRYAERWARHWMDVWRYSDWDGFGSEVREGKPFIWRWRDWIVDSLAQDKPYDQMVREMIAGDELAPDDESVVRATGYLARNWFLFNRNVWLDNTVEHTAKAFLGLTINCARCHDHKYDPIAQSDYYRFRAFFEPYQVRMDRRPNEADTARDAVVRAYDADASAVTYLFTRGNEKQPDKDQPQLPGVPQILCGAGIHVEPVSLPPTAYYPALRGFVQQESLQRSASRLQAAADKMRALAPAESPASARQLALARSEWSAALAEDSFERARVAADRAAFAAPPAANAAELAQAASRAGQLATLRQTEYEVLLAEQALAAAQAQPSGDAAKKASEEANKKLAAAGPALEAAASALFTPASSYQRLSDVYPAASSGRRKALAAWITAADQPLTARVAINHLWLRHFYAPLVPSVFDFGLNGKPPSHPQLLDWLAVELVENGWRMRPIHRLMVTSLAYRRQSSGSQLPSVGAAIDPDNVFLWRANVHRMEAEAVRDSTLHVAGSLDTAQGGPDLDPAAALNSARRSLYFRTSKEKRAVFLTTFDSANVTDCYRRHETVVPQQALAIMNSSLVIGQAQRLAVDLWNRSAPGGERAEPQFIEAAFEQVLGRRPSPAESAQCQKFLAQQAARLSETESLSPFIAGGESAPPLNAGERARANLVHVLFNHNDFVTVR